MRCRRLEADIEEGRCPRYEESPAHPGGGVYVPIRSAFVAPKPTGGGGKWEVREEMLEPPPMLVGLSKRSGGAMMRERLGGILNSRPLGDFGDLVALRLGLDGARSDSAAGCIDVDRFLWLLDASDTIVAVYNTARLSSGTVTQGVCVICNNHIYVFDHSLVLPTGEVQMFFDAQIPRGGAREGGAVCRVATADLRDVQKRNYLLRPVGLELFTCDGLNYLLIFHKSEREAVAEYIAQVNPQSIPKNHSPLVHPLCIFSSPAVGFRVSWSILFASSPLLL
jgi:hypothetical protein